MLLITDIYKASAFFAISKRSALLRSAPCHDPSLPPEEWKQNMKYVFGNRNIHPRRNKWGKGVGRFQVHCVSTKDGKLSWCGTVYSIWNNLSQLSNPAHCTQWAIVTTLKLMWSKHRLSKLLDPKGSKNVCKNVGIRLYWSQVGAALGSAAIEQI